MSEELSPLLQLAVVLIAAKVCGFLSRRANQPEVLGELIVGMILGPNILGIITPQEIFKILAELGAILLLFEVGLESDIRSLALVGRASTLIAALGSAIPFLSGYTLFRILGYGEAISAFLGASMVATSVGISARVLSDLGKLRARESRATLGAAVIDDVIGLFVLSIILSLFTGGRFEAQKILKVAAYVSAFFAASLGIGLKIIPAASRVISEKMKARGVLLSFALAVGILVGHAAEAIGLAAIIGAFIAGMLFAETEQKDTIANDIRPLSQVITPIFFVLMGSAADVRVFPKIFPLTATFIAVAVLSKWIGGALGATIGGLKGRESAVVGVNMIPRGEVGLIFASYGLAFNVIGTELYLALITMALGTTLVTPPLIRLVYARGSSGRN